MRRISNVLIRGLVTVLPVGLTVYLVYWLGITAESLLGGLIRSIVPDEHYWPGLGLLAGFSVLLIVGLLVNAYVVRRLLGFGEYVLERIPLVKTVYGALKDFTRFFPAAGERRDLKRVVTARIGAGRAIGFVTQETVSPRIAGEQAGDMVAVYFPMSYQIGGYTIYLPKADLEETDLSVEEAMRLVLIGGVTSEPAHVPTRPGPEE